MHMCVCAYVRVCGCLSMCTPLRLLISREVMYTMFLHNGLNNFRCFQFQFMICHQCNAVYRISGIFDERKVLQI